jgi:hypothetical protein
MPRPDFFLNEKFWPTLDEIGETYQAVARADKWPKPASGYTGKAFFEYKSLKKQYEDREWYWQGKVAYYKWFKEQMEDPDFIDFLKGYELWLETMRAL